MIDVDKYSYDDSDKEFIHALYLAFERHSEINFKYNNIEYFACYAWDGSNKYWVFKNKLKTVFDTPEDFLLHYEIDGKPFLQVVPDISEYDITG